MTHQLYDLIQTVRHQYAFAAGRVLEVGALDINGSIRPLFTDATEYIATDMLPGAGVDLVLNGHDLVKQFGAAAFDTVLCLETLEHDDQFWVTVKQLHRVLKPGGVLIVSTPTFGFPLHRYPKDYYRYGEDAYRDIILKGLKIVLLAEITDDAGYPGIVGVARKHL